MNCFPYNLSPELFIEAFPFHIVFNRQRQILQVGKSLQNIHINILIGGSLDENFQIIHPNVQMEFSAIINRINSLFVLQCLHNNLQFKGQMMYEQEQDIIFFLGSLLVNDINTSRNAIAAYGMNLRFAIHDQTLDLILLLQGRNHILEDAQELINELNQQQLRLKKALQIQENLTKETSLQS